MGSKTVCVCLCVLFFLFRRMDSFLFGFQFILEYVSRVSILLLFFLLRIDPRNKRFVCSPPGRPRGSFFLRLAKGVSFSCLACLFPPIILQKSKLAFHFLTFTAVFVRVRVGKNIIKHFFLLLLSFQRATFDKYSAYGDGSSRTVNDRGSKFSRSNRACSICLLKSAWRTANCSAGVRYSVATSAAAAAAASGTADTAAATAGVAGASSVANCPVRLSLSA